VALPTAQVGATAGREQSRDNHPAVWWSAVPWSRETRGLFPSLGNGGTHRHYCCRCVSNKHRGYMSERRFRIINNGVAAEARTPGPAVPGSQHPGLPVQLVIDVYQRKTILTVLTRAARCRYGVSYRDLEEMLTERGVAVDHTTIYRWVQRYAPELDKQTCWYRRVSEWRAQSWRVDENLPPDRREVVLFVSGGHLPR
jgi:hypothetical protein